MKSRNLKSFIRLVPDGDDVVAFLFREIAAAVGLLPVVVEDDVTLEWLLESML
jgi:hypothetical protein